MGITVDEKLIAYCGLYCGACKSYLKRKCPGCRENEKLSWCGIRNCGIEHQYSGCAECTLKSVEDCSLRHNFFSKVFALFFGTDRDACIAMIKDEGAYAFAKEMAETGEMSLKRIR